MARLKYALLDRKKFIEQRYEKFLENRRVIMRYPPELRALIIQTDLDPLKEKIVCDFCNEYIKDDPFAGLFHGQDLVRCHCLKCAQESDPQRYETDIGGATILKLVKYE